MEGSNIETIYSMRLAGYLMMRGFVLVGMGKADDDSGRNVFFFNESNELSSAMNDYSLLRSRR